MNQNRSWPGHAEQVQHELVAEGDPAEVQRDGRRGLAGHAGQVVEADAGGGQRLFGQQRPDLADRADQRRLARPEPARDEDLVRGKAGLAAGSAARGGCQSARRPFSISRSTSLPVRWSAGRCRTTVIAPSMGQVGEQHADHAYRQRGVGREVGHRDLLPAQVEDPAVLGGRPRSASSVRRGLPGGDDDGDEVEDLAVGGLGPAAGHGVGPHHRAGFAAPPLVPAATPVTPPGSRLPGILGSAGQVRPGPLDQHRHLVGDGARVGVRPGRAPPGSCPRPPR